MQKYINQLIEDFARAEADPTPEIDFGSSYEEFEKQMHAFENGEKVAPENLINVSYKELPPVEMLNKEQIQRLLISIFNALSAKGTNVSIPGDGVPVEIVYECIREKFKEGFHAMPGWTIDFCSGWCPECKFADYCKTCNETWTKEELEKERNSGDF
jgi:hypothetical protein